ncbi:MAG: UDP-N-acetylmuramoyl-L-alanine--D-glutamate ligase [Candidatus Beckwithbacteria bacterium]|nr:UDP-N-acetylmuramoyl-L-alanine--D-glutamate ligase [Patescibacteria group bacterium]
MQYLNKKIAILGLGLESIDLLDWLKKNSKNCSITIFDIREEIEDLGGNDYSFSLGKDYLKNGLTHFDVIFRSPGFYRLNPELLKAERLGVEITSPTKLFFKLCQAKIIGVTGTKGKGTTTTLINRILKTSGQKSYIAGNIGKPALNLLDKLTSKDWVCLELSSFQLQDLDISPHIAIVLNITSEHLDVHQTTQEYRQAKLNLITHQKKSDKVILNADFEFTKELTKLTPAKTYFFSRQKKVNGCYVENNQILLNIDDQIATIGQADSLLLRGAHNRENITAAIIAAFLAGADLESINQAVFSFKGLKHRLQLIKEVKGITFYNDSFSTTPETAIAALRSFSEPMTIILGGSNKGSDYTILGQEIAKTINLVNIILIGEMAGEIKKAIKKAGYPKAKIIYKPRNMTKIVNFAFKASQKGDVVVLSPACASFDMFKNYKDRGDQFIKAVNHL